MFLNEGLPRNNQTPNASTYLSNQDQPVLPAQHRNNNTSGVEPQGDENGANEGSNDSADNNVDLIGTVRRARHAEWP